jgi:hypothetical protein
MKSISISNLEFLRIKDQSTHEIYYGCDQEWFFTEWQRNSGCGPSVASNIILYMLNKGNIREVCQKDNCKNQCLLLMEEVWSHVTPTQEGIPTTKMFCDLVLPYIKSRGLDCDYKMMDLPEDKNSRPDILEVLSFLEEALLKDSPVAFLNLCNGAEKNLEGWHWVTIISLEHVDDTKQAHIHILDEGQLKKIDFKLWYDTTTRDGGFVYFTVSSHI